MIAALWLSRGHTELGPHAAAGREVGATGALELRSGLPGPGPGRSEVLHMEGQCCAPTLTWAGLAHRPRL